MKLSAKWKLSYFNDFAKKLKAQVAIAAIYKNNLSCDCRG
jgi:hypothetical protein